MQTWGLAGFSNPRVDGPPRDEVGGRERPGLWVGAVRDAEMRSPGSQHTELHRGLRQREAMRGQPGPREGPRWHVAGLR